MRKILYISPDFDECLFNRRYQYSDDENRLINKNLMFFNRVMGEIKTGEFKEVVLMSGSSRQSLYNDYDNSQRYLNLPSTESSFTALDNIRNHLKKCVKEDLTVKDVTVKRDPILLADLYGDRPSGDTFEKATNDIEAAYKLAPALSKPHESTKIKGYDYPGYLYDVSKITLLYMQMHKAASDNPNEEIIFNFYDDRQDILVGLSDFFSIHNYLMPPNLTLNLYSYKGDWISPVKPQKRPLKGPLSRERLIDYDYKESVRVMVRFCCDIDPTDKDIGYKKPLELYDLKQGVVPKQGLLPNMRAFLSERKNRSIKLIDLKQKIEQNANNIAETAIKKLSANIINPPKQSEQSNSISEKTPKHPLVIKKLKRLGEQDQNDPFKLCQCFLEGTSYESHEHNKVFMALIKYLFEKAVPWDVVNALKALNKTGIFTQENFKIVTEERATNTNPLDIANGLCALEAGDLSTLEKQEYREIVIAHATPLDVAKALCALKAGGLLLESEYKDIRDIVIKSKKPLDTANGLCALFKGNLLKPEYQKIVINSEKSSDTANGLCTLSEGGLLTEEKIEALRKCAADRSLFAEVLVKLKNAKHLDKYFEVIKKYDNPLDAASGLYILFEGKILTEKNAEILMADHNLREVRLKPPKFAVLLCALNKAGINREAIKKHKNFSQATTAELNKLCEYNLLTKENFNVLKACAKPSGVADLLFYLSKQQPSLLNPTNRKTVITAAANNIDHKKYLENISYLLIKLSSAKILTQENFNAFMALADDPKTFFDPLSKLNDHSCLSQDNFNALLAYANFTSPIGTLDVNSGAKAASSMRKKTTEALPPMEHIALTLIELHQAGFLTPENRKVIISCSSLFTRFALSILLKDLLYTKDNFNTVMYAKDPRGIAKLLFMLDILDPKCSFLTTENRNCLKQQDYPEAIVDALQLVGRFVHLYFRAVY